MLSKSAFFMFEVSNSHMIKPIQSLRALAVVLVLLFHLDIAFFSRGFLGVDIFFTISGFIIYYTYIERVDSMAGIKTFIKKRFFRIFPASFITAFFTIIAGLAFLLPQDLEILLQDGLLSILSVINIFYLFTINYFSIDSPYRPFLHYWSLAVEEQFYVMFSIFLFLSVSCKNKIKQYNALLYKYYLEATLLFFFILSLVLSFFIRDIYSPADFFNPVTRAWQFIAGMLAAATAIRLRTVRLGRESRFVEILFSGFFIAVICVSIFGFGQDILYDQIALAVGVAVICLMASISISNKLVDFPAFQFIGKISYSLYLVHWPVVVYYRFVVGGSWPPLAIPVLLVITFALAILLHFSVERPWKIWDRRAGVARFAAVSISGLGLFLTVSVMTDYLYRDADQAFRLDVREKAGVRANLAKYCSYKNSGHRHGIICDLGNNPDVPTLYIMGDSHVIPFIPALSRRSDYNVRAYIATGCLPFYEISYIKPEHQKLCDGFYNHAMGNLPPEQRVLLIGRWNGYADLVANSEIISSALTDTTKKLGRRSIYVLQQPFEFRELLPFFLSYARSSDKMRDIVPNPGYFANGIPVDPAFEGNPTKVVETRSQICGLSQKDEAGRCIYSSSFGLYYADDNHLIPNIASKIEIVPKK